MSDELSARVVKTDVSIIAGGVPVTCDECVWCARHQIPGFQFENGDQLTVMSCTNKSHPIAVLPPNHGCTSFFGREWVVSIVAITRKPTGQ